MSKLDELIAELCPDGVAYLPIGKCIQKIENVKRDTFSLESYKYIDLSSVDRNTNMILDTDSITADNAPIRARQIVNRGDILLGTTRPMLKRYCMVPDEYDKQICSTGFCVLRSNPKMILSNWIFHNISSSNFFVHVESFQKGASYPAISDKDVKNYLIPVPPLPVQHEIVGILDNFTKLTAELTVELAAELTARKEQYEYYRNELLTFGDEVLWSRLGENTRIFSASRVHRNEWTASGVPFYRSSDVISIFKGIENSRGKAFISEELFESLSSKSGKVQRDDILITGGGTIGIPYIVPTDEPLYMKDADLICIQKSKQLTSKFLYHYFLTIKFRLYLKSITHDATIAHYTISQIANTPVPIPSLAEQSRIVSILDRFDMLCDDILAGLFAEIEARRKQYEYYRDKLLTFKELEQ